MVVLNDTVTAFNGTATDRMKGAQITVNAGWSIGPAGDESLIQKLDQNRSNCMSDGSLSGGTPNCTLFDFLN